MTWTTMAAAQPGLASAARDLLYGHGIGIAFLATTRRDGGPRVHPVSPLVADAGLFAFIVPGPKLTDLRRDGRYALHSATFPPPDQDDGLYLTGAVEVVEEDPSRRAPLAEQWLAERGASAWPGFDDHVLVRFGIATCMVTLTRPRSGLSAGRTVWHASDG